MDSQRCQHEPWDASSIVRALLSNSTGAGRLCNKIKLTRAAGEPSAAIRERVQGARAYTRILKVARTIANLDGGGPLKAHQVSEAIQYRSLDRQPL